ncbi:MAG: hypothetical protein ACYC6T_11735 [Thermoleophilia bacterium]
MSSTAEQSTKAAHQLVIEETERRLDSYYDLVHPGEDDSPITPMATGDVWLILVVAAALIALWLVGRFVILPIYV